MLQAVLSKTRYLIHPPFLLYFGLCPLCQVYALLGNKQNKQRNSQRAVHPTLMDLIISPLTKGRFICLTDQSLSNALQKAISITLSDLPHLCPALFGVGGG